MLSFVLIIIGLVLLIQGAFWLIDGAICIARRFGISQFIIGIVVVAFGTSLPELFVNSFASFKGEGNLVIGNIIGSNISNILLVLGVSAVIYPLAFKRSIVWKDLPLNIFTVILVIVLIKESVASHYLFSRMNGIIFVILFSLFLYHMLIRSRTKAALVECVEHEDIVKYPFLKVLIGLPGMLLGSYLIVSHTSILARLMGVSEAVIALTMIAIGTSLPELASSVVASYRKNSEMVVGNIVGSNIFNILWVLGISAVVRPIQFQKELVKDIMVLFGVTLMLFMSMFIGKKYELSRWKGLVFLVIYGIYLISIFKWQ